MKKLLSLLTLASVVTLVATMWSCEPKDKPGDSVAQVTKLSAGDPAFPATSLGFMVNASNIESYVYKVVEGANQASPDPAMLFAEAKDKYTIANGEHTIFVYGIEGNKTVTVHFAFKIAGQNKYISQSLSSSTPDYTRLVNVISADRFEIKVQFNVAPDVKFRYAILPRADYYSKKAQGTDEASMLKYGILKQGPQVISYADGKTTGYNDPDTGKPSLATVKPGMPFVVIFGECNDKGEIEYELNGAGGGDGPVLGAPQWASANRPAEEQYTEVCEDKDYKLTRRYARTYVASAKPTAGVGEFSVRSAIAERTATFEVTPPESVVNYGVVIMPKTEYDIEEKAVGKDGILGFILSSITPETGIQTFQYGGKDPMVKGEKYVIVIIGICDLSGESQISKMIEFESVPSTKPAVELVITPKPDLSKPYDIEFNIKAPNKDCASAKYMLDYTKIWVKLLNDKQTKESLVSLFGVAFKAAEIAQINSDAGLDFPFSSWEDIESMLVVNAFNDGEKVSTFSDVVRSGKEPAQPRVESDLFTKLLGNWNVKFTYSFPDTESEVHTGTFVSTISAGPASSDPTFGQSHPSYKSMLNYYLRLAELNNIPEDQRMAYAQKAINDDVVKYNDGVARYTTKYREQNRLVMTGFAFDKAIVGLEYFSSWDLFCTPYYSALDMDQLFYDYGPKMFIGISKDASGNDVASLETDPKVIAPFSFYDENVSRRVVGLLNNVLCSNAFPIEIVDDNTIIIKQHTKFENVDYPFTLLDNNQQPYFAVAKADIVMTRATSNTVKAPYRILAPTKSTGISGKPKRPAIPLIVPSMQPKKPIELSLFKMSGK